ncbi:substrate-binding domain-containing protein [Jiangella anatolica]|uniref:DNA-binding transcriptional regulator n=1 Tax=Jiangella anatolica TaxID=2670374 RepID=A0A2W2CQS3_9ACTN|nr:substrate-binding domain-containing protein [Jiangella anatolica]PZF82563.1 DNA-binding transcriptional regulator [Jiangella anatolica]
MLAAERRAHIVARAREEGAVQVARLVEELGVSHVTIRRDLDALVDERVLDKVRGGAMLRGGAEAASASAPQRFTGSIGLIVPTSYYYRHVAAGVSAALRRRGGEMKLVVSEYDLDEELRLLDEFVRDGIDGLLFAPSIQLDDDHRPLRERLDSVRVPVVLVERTLPGSGLGGPSTVRSAHEQGAVGAVRHLLDLGHRRIVMISRGRTQTADLVRAGWADAIGQARLGRDALLLGADDLGSGPTWNPGAVELVLDRLREHRATALFCHGDENSLLTLIHRARSAGITVPDDLSIIAYDDEISALADPPLSAVAPDREAVGSLATRLLIDRIDDAGEPSAPLHVHVEPRLRIRASTVPPAR